MNLSLRPVLVIAFIVAGMSSMLMDSWEALCVLIATIWVAGLLAIWRASGCLVGLGSLFLSILAHYHVAAVALTCADPAYAEEVLRELGAAKSITIALRVVVCAVVAVVCGYIMYSWRPAVRSRVPFASPRTSKPYVVVAAGVLAITAFLTLNHLWGGGYGEFWMATRGLHASPRASFLMVVGYIAISSGLAMTIVRLPERGGAWRVLVATGVCTPVILYGFRGIATVALLVAAIEWARGGRARHVVSLGCFVAVLVLTLPLIVDIRARYDRRGDAWDSNSSPIERMATESSGTIKALAYCVEKIEYRQTQYWMGRSFLAASARLVPFSTALLPFASEVDARPALWSITEVNRWKFERGLGEGFSAIAEAYLNFGVVGVVLVFFLAGFVFAVIDSRRLARSPDPRWIVAAIWLIWWVRNDSEAILRPLVWSLVAIAIINRAELMKMSVRPKPIASGKSSP